LSVRIRLKRAGSTHRPFYKIIVADSRSPRDGRAIEALGFYDPLKKPEVVQIDEERYNHWLSVGASASEPVETLFKRMKKRAAGIEIPGDEQALKEPIEADEPEAPKAEAAPDAEAAPEAAKAEAAPDAEAAPEAPVEEPKGEGEAAAKKTEEAPEGESDKQ
jgi:small subunit ribosomal protein S16